VVAPGAINTLNNEKGPLLAPGVRDNGALVRKGLSSTFRDGDEVAKLSPFKKMVPLETFVSVAPNVTVVPAAPERVVCVRVISMESAQADADKTSTDITPASR